ncbi:MAG TPA: hypothetical protein PKA28_11025 [Methylomusa anaerophila]|uniref:hypothetical protein n=1 Tax=Methylomusa anaerophila TaxID=1930071 RepID=UPI000F837B55|nr:hypothetical protein [Methylomusa anaerophila]HML88968.1 hypothetical protein [Methylomusa anaerophila]
MEVTQDMVIQAVRTLHNLIYEQWKTQLFLSPKWFGIVAFIIFSYILCFRLLDKTRYTRLFLFGSLITVFYTVYDIIGVNFLLWHYTFRIVPTMPSIMLDNLTIIPLYSMLVFQYTKTWTSFAAFYAVLAAMLSYGLPMFGIVKVINWSILYNIVLVVFLGLLARAVVIGIERLEEKAGSELSTPASTHLTPQPVLKHMERESEDRNEP